MNKHRETLHIKNLTFSYGDKPIIVQLSMDLPLNGLTALSGPSGCGKTTLLRLLAGLEKSKEGSIRMGPSDDAFESADYGRSESRALNQKQVSILFQEDRLLPWRTVREHILDVCPCSSGQADEWLSFAELEEVKDAYPDELSGGQARRLALARCCALGGELLLLDEPFAGVDTARRLRILERLKKMGTPMLLATHEPDVVAECGYVAYLEGPPLRVTGQSAQSQIRSTRLF